ncbi:MAG TPA: efflux RND transporter periplasmic adaptor subunit [Terriglobales bacterium]|nr:efflux RND transporter periplasmic adaptor subunit [Terriglobales bacterium]
MKIALIMVIGLAGVGLGCSDARPTVVAAGSPVVTPAAAAPFASVRAEPSEQSFLASGPLVVENQVDVCALREGVVATISVEPGTRVKTGDVLAQLDDRQGAADLEAARARTRSTAADLHNWESEAKVLDADFQRAQKMWEASLITREVYDHARYKAESDHWDVERVKELLTNAQATERSLELELEKTRIRAPFEGIVARRYVRAGQRVGLGDRLFWVTAEAPLRMRFTLPETFLGHIAKGQQFEVTTPDVEGLKRQAKVLEVSPVVDPSSGTIEVLCQVVGPAGGLRPGMRANIRIPNLR